MSRRYPAFVCLAFFVVALSVGNPLSQAIDDEDQTNAKKLPILVELKERISELVAKSHPKAKTYFQNDELLCEYETETFMVHGRLMSGGYSKKPIAQVGPNANGFLIRINVEEFDNGSGNQAGGLVLGVYRQIYWNDYINVYKITGTNRVIHLRLSYGVVKSQENRKLFDELRKTLTSYGEPILKITKEPEPPKGGFDGREQRQEWGLFRDVAEQ